LKIGVLTGGGVAPGMNTAVRAVAQAAFGKRWEVVAVESGYAGLLEGRFRPVDYGTLSGWMGRGGTMLGTERSEEFATDEGKERAVEAAREAGVEGLVVVGGGGSLAGAHALNGLGLPVVGMPATIDNDIACTDMSIGVDTALNTAVSIIDRIRDTAGSHHRAHVVEVFGRDHGYLAVMSALAGGADAVLTPEFETEPEEIVRLLEESYEGGKPHFIVVVSEGASPTAAELCGYINDAGESYAADLTAAGHIQSGGSPTAFDRILAVRLGAAAVEALADGDAGKMVGLREDRIERVPLETVIEEERPLDQSLYELTGELARIPR
jgi:6-phosphofructokinase 1